MYFHVSMHYLCYLNVLFMKIKNKFTQKQQQNLLMYYLFKSIFPLNILAISEDMTCCHLSISIKETASILNKSFELCMYQEPTLRFRSNTICQLIHPSIHSITIGVIMW